MKHTYLDAGADISPCGRYRYLLWREWQGAGRACLFIMLNPSTADGNVDDPTIRRCVGFAKAWGYGRLEVVNLFAYRATDPRVLRAVSPWDDPVGELNQGVIERAVRDAGKIVCAWGAHGGHLRQDETVLGWLCDRPAFALGFTAAGKPRHPLYAPANAALVPMKGRDGQ